MARAADISARACSNCTATGENVKLCYCKTKMICSKECWSILCSSSIEYKLRCESEMAKLKSELYKDESRKKQQELKELTGSDDKYLRDPVTGRFLTNKKEPTEKDKARQATNSASKQKEQVLIHLKKYTSFRPRNQLAVREIRPNGNAVYWYRTSGYDPITSKTAPRKEPNEEIQSDEDDSDGVIDIENRDPNVIVQERRDLSKTNCSLCHEDPNSCLHMLLDENLATFVGQTAGSKISLVLFKKQILKTGHLTNVISSEGEGDQATPDPGNEMERAEEFQELPMPLTPVIETPENQLHPIPGPSGGTDFQYLDPLDALQRLLSPQETVQEETVLFASF